jgi:hypothetical protein
LALLPLLVARLAIAFGTRALRAGARLLTARLLPCLRFALAGLSFLTWRLS